VTLIRGRRIPFLPRPFRRDVPAILGERFKYVPQ